MIKDDPYIIENKYDDVREKSKKKNKNMANKTYVCLILQFHLHTNQSLR